MLEVIIMFIADIIIKMSSFPFKLLQYAENLTALCKSAIKSVFEEIQNTGEWSFSFKIVKKSATKIESTDSNNESSLKNDSTLPRTD
jgi:hypothetical protein